MHGLGRLLLGVLLLGSGATQAGALPVARTSVPPQIDGRVDEDVWNAVSPTDELVAEYPLEGAVPSERTEVRFLYDDEALYVALVMHDSQPARILAPVARRDTLPPSDRVSIGLDTLHDGRDAYYFDVGAGGTLADGRYHDDTELSYDWDGAWEAAVARTADGWSAEVRIPLRLLRLRPGNPQVWGAVVKREIARTHEELATARLSRMANAEVSRWGTLTLPDLELSARHELRSYVAARLLSAPDAPSGTHRSASGDVGLEGTFRLSPALTLDVTLNPDFGQVESDQLLLNLGTTEVALPEKRPFFTDGLEALTTPGSDPSGSHSFSLFYSRRLGIDSPLLSAAKLVGHLEAGTDFALLDAVTGATPASLSTRGGLVFRPWQPLHLEWSPPAELPESTLTHTFAGVLRRRVSDELTVGLEATSALPLGRSGEQGLSAAATDLSLRSVDGDYDFHGQLAGSVVSGGAAQTLRRDGSVQRPGDGALGLWMSAGKRGGTPLRYELRYQYLQPRFSLDATGFLAQPNLQEATASIGWAELRPRGAVRAWQLSLQGSVSATTDASPLLRGTGGLLTASTTLGGFEDLGCSLGLAGRGRETAEFPGSPLVLERPMSSELDCSLQTDADAAVHGSVGATAVLQPASAVEGTQCGGRLQGGLDVRWTPSISSELEAALDDSPLGPRGISTSGATPPGAGLLVGTVRSASALFTLRQDWALGPRLTLSAYLQYDLDRQHADRLFAVPAGLQRVVPLSSLRPLEGTRTETLSLFAANVVLRWDITPGSTLYAVYTHAANATGQANPAQPLASGQLPAADEGVFLKWSQALGF